ECLGKGRNDSSAMAIADPDFPAVQSPVRTVPDGRRGGLDVLRVGPDVRLGQSIGGEKITASQRREVAILLLVAAMEHDRLGAAPAMNADHYGQRSIDG